MYVGIDFAEQLKDSYLVYHHQRPSKRQRVTGGGMGKEDPEEEEQEEETSSRSSGYSSEEDHEDETALLVSSSAGSYTTGSATTIRFAQQNLHDVPPALIQQVSQEDRMEALHDLHGVLEPIVESPELIEARIQELKEELKQRDPRSQSTTNSLRQAFDQVVEVAPAYVEKQLLKFLRCDRFHIKKSAIRILKHYQAKLELFGSDSLAKEIGLGDLTDVERNALNEGVVQLLQRRDARGRAVIVQFERVAQRYPVEVVAKLLFWLVCVATNSDDEVQKRGIVVVSYAVNVPEVERDVTERAPQLFATFPCVPARIAAVHCCTDDVSIRPAFSVATYYLESRYLFRFQTHFGRNIECRYNLLSFGIPLDALPVREDDSIDLSQHAAWLEELQTREMLMVASVGVKDHREFHEDEEQKASGSSPSSSVARLSLAEATWKNEQLTVPEGPLDVIMGRGLRGRKYPGNQLLRQLIADSHAKYEAAGRNQKAKIVASVYDQMCQRGSRFFEPSGVNEGHWIEMSEEAAKSRIGHGFRNRRLSLKN